MSLHFNHIASCRKSRYHCPCHKSDKRPPAILSFKRRREAILLQLFFILMTSIPAAPHTPSVVGQRRWCQRFSISLCLETIHKNRFDGSCPQVFFSPINWELMIYFYPKYGITDWNKKAITIDNPKTTANSFGFLYKIIIPSIHVITSIRLYI